MYFGRKHLETCRSCSHEHATFLKCHKLIKKCSLAVYQKIFLSFKETCLWVFIKLFCDATTRAWREIEGFLAQPLRKISRHIQNRFINAYHWDP